MSTELLFPPFESKWWNDILDRTNGLKKTSVFKNCMDSNETEEMRGQILDIIRLIIQHKTPEYGFRVFINGKTLKTEELESFFNSSLPNETETFEEWSSRCFGNDKFGIIINRGEKFSPYLVEKIATKIQPLTQKIGIPRLGVTFTIFIGNYGWTPLGIHTDGLGENVMHFHLGKGSKTMYTWDPPLYEANVEADKRFNNTNIPEILHLADEFPFDEGDIYYMPHGEYHVGKSDELSIGLTLWFNNHTKGSLSRKIFDSFFSKNFVDNKELLELDKSDFDDMTNFQDIEVTFQDVERLKKNSGYASLEETYREYKTALFSNCGFWEDPFPKSLQLDNSRDYTIQIISPFKILYYIDNNLNLFVRGRKISLKNDADLLSFVEKLNSGALITKEEAISTFNSSWDLSVKEYMLSTFYSHHILNIKYV